MQDGWAQISTTFLPQNFTITLHGDVSFYGKDFRINEGFIFTDENLPGWIGYISRRHFSIQRETINNKVNYSPAILKVHSKNGIMVNQTLLREGSEQVLKSGDKIMLPAPSGIPLFKFFDKRDFNTAEIPQNILDRYHFDDFIGVGASGSVRKVHNFETGGKFAAKLISRAPRPNEDDEKYGKRLQHLNSEIKTMKMLIHPNVIKFIEHYSSNTQTVIIMELAESGNLLDLLNRYPNNCLPENEAKFCCYQVCKGLEYIHSKGIAHRDIKVDNVFVVNAAQGSNELILKIGDYGYAKSVDEILSTQLGTPYYWPPEIMKKPDKPYTQSADVWSLGCLFYACLSGTFPFYQTHEKSLEVQIASASLDFNRIEHWAEVSENVKMLIVRMIQVEPEKRPTVAMVLDDYWFRDFMLLERVNFIYPGFGFNFPPPEKKQRLM